MSLEPQKMRVIRKVTIEECWWLPRELEFGEELWTYHGQLYGAVNHAAGQAMSERPGEPPFFEVPYGALELA